MGTFKIMYSSAALHSHCAQLLQEGMEMPSRQELDVPLQNQHSDPMLLDSQLPQQLPTPESSATCAHGKRSGPQDHQRQHLMLSDSKLLEPVQAHMLPHLSLHAVAALRASCRTLQHVVDTASEAWLPSASRWLPPQILRHAADSSTVQRMLRAQHCLLKDLRPPLHSAHTESSALSTAVPHGTSVLREIKHEEHYRALDVKWAPAWPSPYIAILFERDEDATASDIDEEDLSDDDSAAVLLDAATWTSLKGLSPDRPYGTDQHGGWCPVSYSNGVGRHTFAFISNGFFQMARVIPEEHRVQDITTATAKRSIHVLTPDGTAGACSFWENGIYVTAICDSQSLIERFRLSPTALTPTSGRLQADMMTIRHDWQEFAPAGNMLAVAWHVSKRPFYLTFHDVTSGVVLKQIDLQACMEISVESTGERPGTYNWSPSGKHVAMILNARPSDPAALEGGIFGVDGMNHELQPHPDAEEAEVHWSFCGRYLHVALSGGVHETRFTASYIWDTLQRENIFEWIDGKEESEAIWSQPLDRDDISKRSVCFVPTCHMLLVLPINGGIERPVRIMYDAPREYHLACFDVSPCGTLLVGTWPVQSPSAMFQLEDDTGADSSDLPLPHHLWHAEIQVGALACCNREAASSFTAWCMDSIVWHPSPASGRLYAIAQEDGAVFLMDGRDHKCLRKWSAEQLHMPQGKSDVRLTWAPDGSQLAVAVWGKTTFLTLSSSQIPSP